MSRVAFITGIAGQDGSYLAEHLLKLGYDVHGMVRRNSVAEHQESRIDHISDQIHTYYGDLTDSVSIHDLLRSIQPDEIYNIAAQSHVRISFEIPQFTAQVNALGVLNMLEAYAMECPSARFYQASSSEMFGNSVDDDGFQRETTPMRPVSPYGCAKVFGYNISRAYRDSYKLHVSNGILFNHESPRRGSNFVTRKVVKAAVRISMNKQNALHMGNLDSERDWGHSKDYVKAMHMILAHGNPDDFVVATGQTRTVREMVKYVFNKLKLDPENHVVIDPKHVRPNELHRLRGDASKIRGMLGWNPTYTFEEILDEMIKDVKEREKNC
jgi:GDPmannose 4,6-dehydratase